MRKRGGGTIVPPRSPLPGGRDAAAPRGGATSSRPLEGRFLAALSDQFPDDRRGTPCGCPAGSHRSPAESPLHVATPGARKDADPSRRLKDAAGRRSRSATRKSPLHPPGSVVPKQWPADGSAVRGEGDHKGRPYETFDSGDAVGAADGQSPPSFSRDHAGGPAVGDFFETSMPDTRQERRRPERRRPRRRLGPASFRAPLGAACFTRRLGGACFRRPVFFARRGDFQSPPGRAVSSRPVGPIPDDRRGTPCGCPAGLHRSPAESPLHVAIPGARKDADPSRRLKDAAPPPPVR